MDGPLVYLLAVSYTHLDVYKRQVMMYRYACKKGYDTSEAIELGKFQDASKVSEFAKEAMPVSYTHLIFLRKKEEDKWRICYPFFSV